MHDDLYNILPQLFSLLPCPFSFLSVLLVYLMLSCFSFRMFAATLSYFFFFFRCFIIFLCILTAAWLESTLLSSSIVGIQRQNQNTTYGTHNGIPLSEIDNGNNPTSSSVGRFMLSATVLVKNDTNSPYENTMREQPKRYTHWSGMVCTVLCRIIHAEQSVLSANARCGCTKYAEVASETNSVVWLFLPIELRCVIHICGTVESSVFYGWFELGMANVFQRPSVVL